MLPKVLSWLGKEIPSFQVFQSGLKCWRLVLTLADLLYRSIFSLIQPRAFVSLMRHPLPHCHLFCHSELLSAVSAVSIVFCRWSVSPTGGDGCLMRNDRPKNLNGQLRFRFGGGIDRSTAAVCLVIDGETPLRKNKCLPALWGGQTLRFGVSPLSTFSF